MENDNNINNNETNNNNNSKKTGLIILIIAIIVVLAFAVVFFVMTKQNNKDLKTEPKTEEKEETKDEEVTPKEEEKEEEIQVDIDKLGNGIPYGLCGGIGFPFEGRDIYLKDLSDSVKLDMLMKFLSEEEFEEIDKDFVDNVKKIRKFTEKDAKRYFEDTSFMKKIGKVQDGIYSLYDIDIINKEYYLVIHPKGCEGPMKVSEAIILVNNKREGNYVIKTYRYLYGKVNLDKGFYVDEETNTSYAYYDYYKDRNAQELLLSDVYKQDQLTPYIEKLDTYDLYYDVSKGNDRFVKMVYHKNNN